MSKELTEKLKGSSLNEGCYYIETDVGTMEAIIGNSFHGQKLKIIKGFFPKGRLKEVLAPVPSYEEYQKLQERLADADKALKAMDEKYCEHYTTADGAKMGNSPSWKYMLKWGVK